MFTQLIFLMILLILTSFENQPSQLSSFFFALGGYVFLLAGIALQNRLLRRTLRRNKDNVLFLVNLEILTFLFFLFIFVGIPKSPYMPATSSLLLALLLYFGALFVFHYSSFRREPSSRQKHAWGQIRLLLPFVLPILLYSVISDLLALTGFSLESLPIVLLVLISMILAGTLLLFLPPALIRIWKCTPLENSELHHHLKDFCKRANFSHAGMKLWTVLNYAPTAAIIGILPRYRYVLFTKKLLDTSTKDDVESILAHEIGHSAHKHLLKLPFVLLGMAIVATLFLSFVESSVTQYFDLSNWLSPSPHIESYALAAIFVPLAILVALYIRFVFGYFSRLFERQADLYGIELGLPAENMIHALEGVATAAGNIHDVPSWHHFSINERIAYLRKVQRDPSLIHKHNLKTNLSFYAFLLLIFLGLLILAAPEFPSTSGFSTINAYGAFAEKSLANSISLPLRISASDRYTAEHGMEKYQPALQNALLQAFSVQGVFQDARYLDHAVLSYLLKDNESQTAAALAIEILHKCQQPLHPRMIEQIQQALPDSMEGRNYKERLRLADLGCTLKRKELP